MRLEQYLKEKYDGRFKDKRGGSTEIFINPSKSEFREVAEDWNVRFFAYNKTKKFYIWNPGILHADVVRDYIDISEWGGESTEKTYFLGGQTLQGVARLIGGKWQLYNSDVIEDIVYSRIYDFSFDQFIEMLENKWKWVERYISFDYVEKKGLYRGYVGP